ncbi:MAG: alpha/beta hydrolase [Candidatus Euphemobacter frigidus]|nr:alpha/beta hydrolase [Candidatus Euphemobacter frigidus]MDP8275745.1 alpha/beta hydrolase [Candidatus Euphemobacter frigidus]
MKIIVTILLIGLLVLLVWWLARRFERSRMYYPQSELEASPSEIGLDYEDVTLTASDGVRIHGWWIPAGASRGSIIFCHGNAGNISHRLDSIRIFHELGLDVFIYDYRGYGRSGGSPSEEGTYRDATAAYDYLRKARGIPLERIIIFGRSLGGAVAVELAHRRKASLLICESAFTSAVDMGKLLFPYLPVDLLVFDKYDSVSKVESLTLPKLFIHSRKDDLVPFEQGRRLYRVAAEPKEFLEIRGNHGEGFLEDESIYCRAIDAFLGRYLPG